MTLPPIWDPNKTGWQNRDAMNTHKQSQDFWDGLNTPIRIPSRDDKQKTKKGERLQPIVPIQPIEKNTIKSPDANWGKTAAWSAGIIAAFFVTSAIITGSAPAPGTKKKATAENQTVRPQPAPKQKSAAATTPATVPAPKIDVFHAFPEGTVTIPYGPRQTHEEALQSLFRRVVRDSGSTMFGADLNTATGNLAKEASYVTMNGGQLRGGFHDPVNGDSFRVSLAPLDQQMANGVVCVDSPYGIRSLNRVSMVPGMQDGLKITFSSSLTGASGEIVSLTDLARTQKNCKTALNTLSAMNLNIPEVFVK
ncbi:MAG: hypothetical protein JWO78_73 [Micavibrio sp.]|nr:hypothetical protein [Micavibrio sp.]